MRRRWIAGLVMVLLAVIAFAAGMIVTEAGSWQFVRTLLASIPGQRIRVNTIEGRLWDRLLITGLNIGNDEQTIGIESVKLDWRFSELFAGRLHIIDLSIDGVSVELLDHQKKASEPFDLDGGIRLPVEIAIDKFSLNDTDIIRKDGKFRLESLQLGFRTENRSIRLTSLRLDADVVRASASGTLGLTPDMPLSLKTDWTIESGDYGRWQGVSAFSGDRKRLNIDNRVSSPFHIVLDGYVDDPLKTPKLALRGRWQSIRWPIVTQPVQIDSPNGRLEIDGLLSNYSLKLAAELNQHYLRQAELTFAGRGGLDKFDLHNLQVKSNTGIVNLRGRLDWRTVPVFDFTAVGDHFNPGVIVPDFPGDVTLACRVSGTLAPDNLQIDAALDKLTGRLRRQALAGKGRFRIVRQRIDVEAFAASLGANKLDASGSLAPSGSDFKFNLDLPGLDALWPGLNGRIRGNGTLRGNYLNPAARLDLTARTLRTADFQVKQADIRADYSPESGKTSLITIAANGIETKSAHLDAIDIEGRGTPEAHALDAGIVSPNGSLTAHLSGGVRTDNWQGQLKTLDVKDPNRKTWSLQNPMRLSAIKKSTGYDFSADKGCLANGGASACIHSAFYADTDFNTTTELVAIPTESFRALLPKTWTLSGLIDGRADIRRQKNRLSGQYDIQLSPAEIKGDRDGKSQPFKFGPTSAAGRLNGDNATLDFKLNLPNSDGLTGNLIIDIGNKQTLSGRLQATLTDFSTIRPLISQVGDLNGKLRADLTVRGTLGEPLIGGRLDLNEGAATVGDPNTTRIGLRRIELHAEASGERIPRFDLNASAIPVILNAPKSPRQIDLKSFIRLDANLIKRKSYFGRFALNVPPDSVLTVTDKDDAHTIAFGATSLKGSLGNDRIEADLDMSLAGGDFVRGKLNADTGASQALDGWLKASFSGFATIEKLVPQLSNVKGAMAADLTIGGTAQGPMLNGKASLTGGEVDMKDVGLALRAVNVRVETPPDNHRLLKLKGSARSGDGSIDLIGKIELDPSLHYPMDARLNGENFEVVKLPEAQIVVSPDLSLTVNDAKKSLTGQLKIPKAVLQLEELPENAVTVSEDEIILGEEPPTTAVVQAPGIDTAIEVQLGKEVTFKGLGLQTALKGRLNLVKTAGKFVVQGNVDMEKGSYKRFGQNLTLRKGRFLFNGPADNPWLDVEATRLSKSQKVTAMLSLTGNLKNPQTHITSDPPLPESEALAYLVTGSPLNQVSQSENNMLASAALSYGAGKASWLTEKLGISEFDVVEGTTLKDTLLVMGQYLTPDFYVGTKIGMFNKQAVLVLKHKLTDAVNVETQTGTSQRIKLNYEFDGE